MQADPAQDSVGAAGEGPVARCPSTGRRGDPGAAPPWPCQESRAHVSPCLSTSGPRALLGGQLCPPHGRPAASSMPSAPPTFGASVRLTR